jgi:hypothetical protein
MEKFSENIERHEDTNPRSSEAIKQDKWQTPQWDPSAELLRMEDNKYILKVDRGKRRNISCNKDKRYSSARL